MYYFKKIFFTIPLTCLPFVSFSEDKINFVLQYGPFLGHLAYAAATRNISQHALLVAATGALPIINISFSCFKNMIEGKEIGSPLDTFISSSDDNQATAQTWTIKALYKLKKQCKTNDQEELNQNYGMIHPLIKAIEIGSQCGTYLLLKKRINQQSPHNDYLFYMYCFVQQYPALHRFWTAYQNTQ